MVQKIVRDLKLNCGESIPLAVHDTKLGDFGKMTFNRNGKYFSMKKV